MEEKKMNTIRENLKKKDVERFCEDNFLSEDISDFLIGGLKVYTKLDVEYTNTDDKGNQLIVRIPLSEV